LLIVLSVPSGSGKSSVLREVFAGHEFPLTPSVSCTTRAPRPGEVDGEHYRFLAAEEFATLRAAGGFLECAEVHGHWYGTPAGPVADARAAGRWALLEIDVQGFRQVKAACPDAVSVFLRPPSLEDLEQRLRRRGTEDAAKLARRLADARLELDAAPAYDHQIVNQDLAQAVRTFRVLLRGIAAGAAGERTCSTP
jgi:guanylate kinase